MAAPSEPRRRRGGRAVYLSPKAIGQRSPQDVDVTLTALGGRGDGLGRLPSGEVVLVAGGVPGERVGVRLLPPGRGPRRGDVLTVLEASPARVEPPCPVFARCGGCALQHIDAGVQAEQKRAWLERLLQPGDPPLQWLVPVAPFGHRRRVRFHLRRIKGVLAAGFMERASDALATTPQCRVLVPALDRLLVLVPPALEPFVEHGEVHATAGREGVVVRIDAAPRSHGLPVPPRLARDLAAVLGIEGLALHLGRTAQQAGRAEVTLPETAAPARAGGHDVPVRVDAGGFSQATAAGNAAIRTAVANALADAGPVARVQEFFAGSGNLTALLIGHVGHVRTVEADSAAVGRAQALVPRAASLGTVLTVDHGDAAALATPPAAGELWLLDPGRPGAADLCRRAALWQPRHVVYVSCAPDTLARDLRTLRTAGYVVRSAVGIDSLPQTVHVEAILRLEFAPDRATTPGRATTPECATSSR